MLLKTYYQFDNLIDQIKAQHPTMEQFDTVQNLLIFECRPLSTDWVLVGDAKDYVRQDYLQKAITKLKSPELRALMTDAIDTTRQYHRHGLTFKLIGINPQPTD